MIIFGVLQESFLLVCILGLCSAAVVYNAKPISGALPVNNDQPDLVGAESASYQSGFGSPFGFGGGFGRQGGLGRHGFNSFGGGFGRGGHHHHHHHG